MKYYTTGIATIEIYDDTYNNNNTEHDSNGEYRWHGPQWQPQDSDDHNDGSTTETTTPMMHQL